MMTIEIGKIQCVWHVFINDTVKIACNDKIQAERIAMRFALFGMGTLNEETL